MSRRYLYKGMVSILNVPSRNFFVTFLAVTSYETLGEKRENGATGSGCLGNEFVRFRERNFYLLHY